MYIKEIFIDSFGCISNKKYVFSDGVNVLYGPNESGKTTLLDFILFVFYGFKIKKEREDAKFKNKYMFSEFSSAGGKIRFVSQGLEYYLKRVVNNKQSEVSLFCVTTSEEIKEAEILSSPGNYFFGVHSEAFLKTAYFSSASAKINTDSSDEIITKLRNLFESGNIDVSYKEISDKINEEINNLESQKRRNSVIPNIENEIEKLKEQISFEKSQRDKYSLETEKYDKLKNQINNLSSEIESAQEKRSGVVLDDGTLKNYLKEIIFFVLCSLVFISAIFLFFYNRIYGAVIAVVSCLMLLCSLLLFYLRKKRTFKERQRKLFTLKAIDDKIELLKSQMHDAEIDAAVSGEKIKSYSNFETDNASQRLALCEKEHENALKRLKVLKLSMSCVQNAYEDMKTLFSPELCRKAGNVLKVLSGDKYNSLLADDSFNVNILTENGYMSANYLSRGALELTFISLRFALVDLILKEKNTPLFLDDAFAFFDNYHLDNAFNYICEISQQKQVFIATCREDEYVRLKDFSNIIYF